MILINFTSENNENSSEIFSRCVKTLSNRHKANVNDIIQISNKNIVSVSQDKKNYNLEFRKIIY